MRHHGFEVVTRALDGDMKCRLDFKSILTQEASTKVAEEPADPRSQKLTSGSTSYTGLRFIPFATGLKRWYWATISQFITRRGHILQRSI